MTFDHPGYKPNWSLEGLQNAFPAQVTGMQSANNPAFAGRGIPAVRQMWNPWFDAVSDAQGGGDINLEQGRPFSQPQPQKKVVNPYGDPAGTGANLDQSLEALRGLYK